MTALGLEVEGSLAGAVLVSHDSRKGWINRLVIDPEHRRRGLARGLLAAAEERLRAEGIRIIGALVEEHNRASLDLFQREGYRLSRDILYLSKREDPTV
jgi:ribosomal protein S18 acetylase RimI-like enzyme